MEKPDRNARLVADFLRDHAKVANVHYLAHHEEASPAGRLFARQCTGEGSTFSFDIVGGQVAAFKFLNALQIFKLAVPARPCPKSAMKRLMHRSKWHRCSIVSPASR